MICSSSIDEQERRAAEQARMSKRFRRTNAVFASEEIRERDSRRWNGLDETISNLQAELAYRKNTILEGMARLAGARETDLSLLPAPRS